MVKDQIKVLAEEIRIIKPEKIIAFGGLVFKTLTGNNIKLADYWNGPRKEVADIVSGLAIPVIPC